MAAMATPDQAMHRPVVEIRRSSHRMAWAVWIIASVVGAAIGGAVAWEIRSVFLQASAAEQGLVGSAATLLSALILAGSQWLVLRRYRVDVFWWVPATMAANFVAAGIVVPGVINLALGRGVSPLNLNSAVIFGTVVLATQGLTFVVKADTATADRVAQQFHKMIGVRSVMVLANEDSTMEAKR